MKEYVQLAAVIGNWDNNSNRMYKDNFFTFLQKDSENNKGIRKTELNKHGSAIPTYQFENETQQNNFIDYLKTDFARFCLALEKNGCSLYMGEIKNVPYLDFNECWSDSKLYSHFNVSPELQQYIQNFLPDYHNIRFKKDEK